MKKYIKVSKLILLIFSFPENINFNEEIFGEVFNLVRQEHMNNRYNRISEREQQPNTEQTHLCPKAAVIPQVVAKNNRQAKMNAE